MTKSRTITISSDPDGYFSFHCPHGGERFRLSAAELSQRDPQSLYCPLCGLSAERANFMTPEARAALEATARNMAIDAINEALSGLRRAPSTRGVTIRPGKPLSPGPVPEVNDPTVMAMVQFQCCGSSAKVATPEATSPMFCPYCGAVAS